MAGGNGAVRHEPALAKVLHEGEFVVALYEAMPAIIDIPEPYPYDEYVRVLEGSVVLTSSEGERQSYEAGDAFLVPVGWTGTGKCPLGSEN